MTAAEEHEARVVRQSRAAAEALSALPPRRRESLARRGLVLRGGDGERPASEYVAGRWQPIEDHAHTLACSAPPPGDEPVSDGDQWEREREIVRLTLEQIVPALTAHLPRGGGIASALLAVLRGEHQGEPLTAVAKAHTCPARTLRPLLAGVRRLIDE